MSSGTVYGVYFSATGTTRGIVEAIAREMGREMTAVDVLQKPLTAPLALGPDDVAIVGIPVYAGRVPGIALKSIVHLQGSGTPAIAVAVYGNRDYEDALVELSDALERNGLRVVSAGAFIAEHSIVPQVAKGRPDAQDATAIASFAKECSAILADNRKGTVAIKGNRPYKPFPPDSGLRPVVDADKCIGCGNCVSICPTGALAMDKEKQRAVRDNAACIACAACFKVCPTGAQGFRGEKYEQFAAMFAQKLSARCEPEVFFPR